MLNLLLVLALGAGLTWLVGELLAVLPTTRPDPTTDLTATEEYPP